MEQPQYHLQNVVHAKQTLEDFDGPLDVILLLLSKNKIEIQDISISSILEQYLAWLDERKRMDMEVASEFIAMASHLMYIKTRMLLSEAEKAEAESEMEELIASLRQRQRKDAYEQIKIACGALALRNDIGLGMFPKQPEPLRRDQTYRYQHDRQDLLDALAAMQDRSQRRLPPPVSNFAGIVGAVSGGKEGCRGAAAAHWARRDEISLAFQGQPQPVRDCGDLFVSAGALQAPLGAH